MIDVTNFINTLILIDKIFLFETNLFDNIDNNTEIHYMSRNNLQFSVLKIGQSIPLNNPIDICEIPENN